MLIIIIFNIKAILENHQEFICILFARAGKMEAIQVMAHPPVTCVPWGQFPNISVPQLPHLWDDCHDHDRTGLL